MQVLILVQAIFSENSLCFDSKIQEKPLYILIYPFTASLIPDTGNVRSRNNP